MAISSFPASVGLETNQIYLAQFANSVAGSTYQTLLNITSGIGKLHFVSLCGDGIVGGNAGLDIKITIDGTLYTISPSSQNHALGLPRDGNSSNWNSLDNIDLRLDIVFKTSLKIEIQHTDVASKQIDSVAVYSLK